MRLTMTIAGVMFGLLSFPGCYTISSNYTPPTASPQDVHPVDVDNSLDSAWAQLIRGLAIRSFDIVTMDRATGFVSATCTGDPEAYVDGGEMTYAVKVGANIRGIHRYPATKADTNWTGTYLGDTYRAERHVYLDGKVNIILQATGPHRTRMTVTVRYTLDINDLYQPPGGEPLTSQEVISFTTGQTGKSRSGMIFQPTGRLEEEIVALAR